MWAALFAAAWGARGATRNHLGQTRRWWEVASRRLDSAVLGQRSKRCDDGYEDVGDAGYLSVFRRAACPNVAAPSRELEFG